MTIEITAENGNIKITNSIEPEIFPNDLNEYEKEAVSIIKKILEADGFAANVIRPERRTSNYLTLLINNTDCKIGKDFCRIKMTARTSWVALELCEFMKQLESDPRIDSVNNKNQRMWKIKLNSAKDLYNYADLICLSFKKVFDWDPQPY